MPVFVGEDMADFWRQSLFVAAGVTIRIEAAA